MRDWKFLNNVLQRESDIREEAGWALLHTIRELLPAKIARLDQLEARLKEIRPTFEGMEDDEIAFGEEQAERIFEEVRTGVERWTKDHHIDCPAVNAAALRLVCGDIGPEKGLSWTYVNRTYQDEHGRDQVLPFIWTYPPDESKDDFLTRAGAYYDGIVRLLKRAGDRTTAFKRDVEHFRWLVLQYVGGHSPTDIARGNVAGFKPSRNVAPVTVAGEVRRLADWLGIERSKAPGPRRGSKHPRKRKRPRRA